MFAFDAADVLAYHHDAVVALAFAGAVGELGDVFVVEPQVEVSALFDDFLLAVGAPGPGRAGLVLIRRRTLQPLPRRRAQCFGSGAQGFDVVRAQDEVDLLRPPVEVGGQGEVGVPAHAHPLRVRRDEGDRLVDPHCGVLVAGRVARPVDQVEHFPGVGQRDQQWCVAPDPLVGDVHALLQLACGGHDRAVDVEIGHLAEQVRAPTTPQRWSYRVDSVHQRHDVGLGEAAQEVSRCGRVRQQLRPESVHQRHVVAQAVHVLQPGAAGEHAVGQGEHVVGLVIGQVHLQQLDVGIDRPGQTEPDDQAVHREDPAVRGRFNVAANLVADLC